MGWDRFFVHGYLLINSFILAFISKNLRLIKRFWKKCRLSKAWALRSKNLALVVTCFTFCNFTVLKKIYKFKSCDLNLHTGSTDQFWFFFSKYFYFEPETLLPYWHKGQLVGRSSGQTRKCRWKNELKNTHIEDTHCRQATTFNVNLPAGLLSTASLFFDINIKLINASEK